ncbi:MAG: ISL3 family transposase [Chloroflexales bacterium]|nr:ISL3 family transposase [Chloroflexales bacterium]
MIPFPLPGCVVTGTVQIDKTLVVDAHTTAVIGFCPTCQHHATRVHSRYLRTPRDLPVLTQHVQLRLLVRRFFCDQPACPRRTFAEGLPELLPRKAQRTTRLTATLHDIGAEVGGTGGAALAGRLRIRTSPDTIVRILRCHACAPLPTPRVLGVDDFALQKGRVYGTILVDIERAAPIDLLPDRRPETLAAWLQDHPGVDIITRDRSTEFTRGATDGAPAAIQVADRGTCSPICVRPSSACCSGACRTLHVGLRLRSLTTNHQAPPESSRSVVRHGSGPRAKRGASSGRVASKRSRS